MSSNGAAAELPEDEGSQLPDRQVARAQERADERQWMARAQAMTPMLVEAKLLDLANQMAWADKELKAARDQETQRDITYRKARLVAFHDRECPKVARGSVTVGERDAWVDDQVFEEWAKLREAETRTENAKDHVRMITGVTTTVQTIARLVEQAYNLAGRTS